MDITIQQNRFLKILNLVQSISDRKSTMPILSYFLMRTLSENQIELFATDLNVGLVVRSESKVKQQGTMLLPSKKLFSIVHELPEKPVHVQEGNKEGWCLISCEKSRFKIPYLEGGSFPKKPEFPQEFSNILPSDVLLSIFDKTLFAAANEETRYNLNCIFMKKIPEKEATRIVATDGHRLVQMDLGILKDLELQDAIMIPKKGMTELKRILGESKEKLVGFEVRDKNAYFQIGDVGMSVRLMEGDYPDYQQVIPKVRGRRIHMNRWDLMAGIKRVSRISMEESDATLFSFKNKELHLKMGDANTGIARETIDIPYEGDPVTFAFNYRYCLDILGAIEEEEIEMELLDEDNPGIFRGKGNEETFYLIMPINIEEEEDNEQDI